VNEIDLLFILFFFLTILQIISLEVTLIRDQLLINNLGEYDAQYVNR